MIQFAAKKHLRSVRAFSLVEVTIALGLVSYTMLGLLGLFVVGLNSSRESSEETALAQIALHVSSSYNPALLSYELTYSVEGLPLETANDPAKHFTVAVTGAPHDPNPKLTEEGTPAAYSTLLPEATSKLHLVTLSITSITSPNTPKVIQASAYVP